ncbi:MAG: LysR family transcriptional regulator [Coriobacteriales bacterium]
MKLQRIRYFVTLSQTLSFSRTAEIHCVSQTTVSQQIRLLERELGHDLFVRTRRHVELTPAGRAYLADARRALQILNDAEDRVRTMRDDERLSLRVRLIHGITPDLLAPALRGFSDTCPDVALDCSYCPANELLASVSAGDADLGIRYGIERDYDMGADAAPRHLRTVEVAQVRQLAIVSRTNPLATRATLAYDQLASQPFVNAIASSDAIPLAAAEAATPEEGAPRTDVMVDSMDSLLLAVALGDGYTLMSEPVARDLPDGLGVVAIPLEGKTTPIVACYREDAHNDAIERFLGYLEDHPLI